MKIICELKKDIVAKFEPFKSKTTLEQIEQRMTSKGSRWWDLSWFKIHPATLFEPVYKKDGRYYFLCREQYENNPFRPGNISKTTGYCLRQYDPDTNEISVMPVDGKTDLLPLDQVLATLEQILL